LASMQSSGSPFCCKRVVMVCWRMVGSWLSKLLILSARQPPAELTVTPDMSPAWKSAVIVPSTTHGKGFNKMSYFVCCQDLITMITCPRLTLTTYLRGQANRSISRRLATDVSCKTELSKVEWTSAVTSEVCHISKQICRCSTSIV
jgi:hypothetical protein